MGIKFYQCHKNDRGMKCGNSTFRVIDEEKVLFCAKCKGKIPLMSFFADVKEPEKEAIPSPPPKEEKRPLTQRERLKLEHEVPPVPDFANSQKEGDNPIEITDPIRDQIE